MRKHVAPSPGWYCLEGSTCKLTGSCPFLKLAVWLDLSPCPSFPGVSAIRLPPQTLLFRLLVGQHLRLLPVTKVSAPPSPFLSSHLLHLMVSMFTHHCVGHFSNCWDLTSSKGRQKGLILAHSLWRYIDHLSGKGTMTERGSQETESWQTGSRMRATKPESFTLSDPSPPTWLPPLNGSPAFSNRWERDPIHKPVKGILHSNHNDSKHSLNDHTILKESSPSRNSVFIHPWLVQDDFKGQASGMPRRNNSMLLSLAFSARMEGKP